MSPRGWIVYQLSDAGEKATDLGALRRDLLSRGADEVFIPAYVSVGERVTEIVYLYEGYLFARVSTNPVALENSHFIECVLSIPYQGSSKRFEPATVPDSQVQRIRDQLRQLVPTHRIGSKVRITKGTYSNIEGTVVVDPTRCFQDRVQDTLCDGIARSCVEIAQAAGLQPPQVNTPLQKFKKRGLVVKREGHRWQWVGNPPEDIAVALHFHTFDRIIRVALLFLDSVDLDIPPND